MEGEDNRSSSSSNIVPEKVMEGVRTILANIDELKSNFDEFISLASDSEIISQLPPLERAQSLLLLAKLTSVLLAGNLLFFSAQIFVNLSFLIAFYDSNG